MDPAPHPAVPPEDEIRRSVEEVLSRYLDRRCAGASLMEEDFARELASAVRRFVLGGGKRLRSSFLWWGWRAFVPPRSADPDSAAVLQIAGALEILQACALIHDDVMDGARLRRGRTALHADFAQRHARAGMTGPPAAYGTSLAILAGDLALAWADDMFAEAPLAPGTRDRIRSPWRAMRTEMVAGQFLDLHAQATGSASPRTALRIAYLKSALYTVERPLALGAELAGAGPENIRALRAAGRCTGLAFQLRDDLLGVFGDSGHTGKPVGDDVREGKITYLVALALSLADGRRDNAAGEVLRAALGRPQLTAAQLTRFTEVLIDLGARAAVEQRIRRLAGRALRHLACAGVDAGTVAPLTALVLRAAGTPDGPEPPPPAPDPADRAGVR
ncbi:polyprenyl synthetase family protein [Streptomyces meridianus]|uniref:Polyprenyl synthetase family protein n=1 Tax=Streptomyces meridianus TaxID=2938945 RepID=A0ABT0XDC2_9ACTN|nr:polyprenyl synthetase family protein [Streptomyces meridianus]MCM2580521.1 polyprenyl synthetase family protein [Streptomyces meridianus]